VESMNKRDAGDQRMLWLNRLLCQRYVAGVFSAAVVLVRSSDGIREQVVHWAIGCLHDRECELLGAWAWAGIGSAPPPDVFADLQIRGVERIRFLVGSDLAIIGGGMQGVPFGATELPSIEQTFAVTLAHVAPRHRGAVEFALRVVTAAGSGEAAGAALTAFERGQWGEMYPQIVVQWRLALTQLAPLFALPTSLRRVVDSGDRTAANLHRSLVRAIDRHGSFVSQAAALEFVVDALLRAERRLDRARAVAVTQPRIRRVGASGGQPAFGMQRRASALGVWVPR
jgi:transposase-like protein